MRSVAATHPLGRDGTLAIEAISITKDYLQGAVTVRVLDEVSVAVETGSFVSIVGPSGCGKTTLLRILAGLRRASAGEVIVGGREIGGHPPDGLIYVFQQYTTSILPWRSVLDNVRFGLEVEGTLSRAEITSRAREYLQLVGLEGRESLYPAQLSGGMQQRLALARALVCHPAILLMDEPFSAVDAITRMKLQDLVAQLWSRLGLTIVFVTHDIDEAVFLSTRILAFGPLPAGIQLDIGVPIAFPRDHIGLADDADYRRLRKDLLRVVLGESPT